jgi:hypothetical protein
MRSGILGAAFVWAAVLPAYAESDIALSGNAAFLTQYVDRGLTNSAERPAVQAEFDLYYDLLRGHLGVQRELRRRPQRAGPRRPRARLLRGRRPDRGKMELRYCRLLRRAFDPDGEFNYVEIGVRRISRRSNTRL